MHLGILSAGIENGAIGYDLQGHLAISTQNWKTAFNVALVFWSKTAKGCYTAQRALIEVCNYANDVSAWESRQNISVFLGYPYNTRVNFSFRYFPS